MKQYILNNTARTPHNPFAQSTAQNTQIQDVTIEAVVVDVVVNDDHPEYMMDGYNIGAIKFRLLKSQMHRADDTLHWALPIDANITEYPLLNEVVIVIESLQRWYYTRKLNTSSRVTSHGMFGLNEELSPAVSSTKRTESFIKSTATPSVKVNNTNKLGKYFVEKPGIYRLRHDEGDIVFEGRSGQSIRFGAAWRKGTNFQSNADQAPNLLLRVGPSAKSPNVKSPYGLVVEDVNKDDSSLYLVSDQIVPLQFATEKNSVHTKSIVNFPSRLDGRQIVINTDRFVINTRANQIMGFSGKGIHWTANEDYTVDSGRDVLKFVIRDTKFQIGRIFETKSGDRTSFIAPKVYVGMQNDETEPIPAGASLAAFLQAFIDAHLVNATNHVITPMGPGILSPAVIQALTKLKTDVAKGKFASFNSVIAYVRKT